MSQENEYLVLGFSTGCNPCNKLKQFMDSNNIKYTFVDAKVPGQDLTTFLKKEVGKLPEENRVVPALFSTTHTLITTGVESCIKHLEAEALSTVKGA